MLALLARGPRPSLRTAATGALCLALAPAATPPRSEAAEPDSPTVLERIAFGSCARQDRPQPIWDAVLATGPDLFLFLGDNIYADTEDPEVMRQKYARLAAQEGFRALRDACPVLSVWDDHDYGRNDAGKEYVLRETSEAIFLDFFNVPEGSPRRRREGIYGAQTFGPAGRRVQIILLDTRSFRDPLHKKSAEQRKTAPGGPYRPSPDLEATLLGAEQWSWLGRQLASPAELRLIVSSIQFVSTEHGWETWGNFPRERERLLALIGEVGAAGVIFLSGDRHLGELSCERGTPGVPYPIYDLTSSGLTQSGGGRADEPNRHRQGETYRKKNFGSVAIDWDRPTPVVHLRVHDAKGVAVIDHPVTLDELRPAALEDPFADAPAADGAGPARSVSEIATAARPSLVTVSHTGRSGEVEGVGSGFVVGADGLIATCAHVVGEARAIEVTFPDGSRYPVAAVHAWDRKLDLALLRIDATGLPPLPLGDSDRLAQGAAVVAMGNPQGLEHSVVQGVVSGRRTFESSPMIQLAIPIEPGNSGGPLLDMEGRVHGLLTMKSAITENLGFAMPVNALKLLLEKPNPIPMGRWLTIGALDPKRWEVVQGARWRQSAGRIQVESRGEGFGGRALCLRTDPAPEVPYEIAVSVRLDDEAGAAGLAFAADGADRHYGFYPSGGQLRLTRFDGPDVYSWTILAQVPSDAYRPGDWNRLRVRVEEDGLTCFVNGWEVVRSDDRGLTGGRPGLCKFRQTRAEFKGFKVGSDLSRRRPPAQVVAGLREKIGRLGEATPDDEALGTFLAHPDTTQELLEDRARQLERNAEHLRSVARRVHHKRVEEELVNLLRADDPGVDLVHAGLLIARLDDPEIDVAAYREEFERMVEEVAAALPEGAAEGDKIDALNDYLFVQNGFHGSRTDYYNRANSYLSAVIDDREGIPITLSVLYLELARRAGIEGLAGVGLPGHFMVAFRTGDEAAPRRYIDVFDRGKSLDAAEAGAIASGFSGLPVDADAVPESSAREIVIRMLRNLKGIALQAGEGDPGDPLRYVELMVAVSPEDPAERLSRALLRYQSGDTDGARIDLRWLLETRPENLNLDRLEAFYHQISGEGGSGE